jgi:hypothetical protein
LNFYNDMLNILKILKSDAYESNEAIEFQYKLDELTLFFIQYDYDESLTPFDLIIFMIHNLLNNDTLEKYFKNLLQPAKELIPLLEIFDKITKPVSNSSSRQFVQLSRMRTNLSINTKKLTQKKQPKFNSRQLELIQGPRLVSVAGGNKKTKKQKKFRKTKKYMKKILKRKTHKT